MDRKWTFEWSQLLFSPPPVHQCNVPAGPHQPQVQCSPLWFHCNQVRGAMQCNALQEVAGVPFHRCLAFTVLRCTVQSPSLTVGNYQGVVRPLYVKNWRKLNAFVFDFGSRWVLPKISRAPWDSLGPSRTPLGGPRWGIDIFETVALFQKLKKVNYIFFSVLGKYPQSVIFGPFVRHFLATISFGGIYLSNGRSMLKIEESGLHLFPIWIQGRCLQSSKCSTLEAQKRCLLGVHTWC